MGMLGLKYNCAEMAQILGAMLQPGENLITAVYATFHRGAFEVGSSVMAGYVGITDQHRLIGCKYGLIGEEPFFLYLQGVKKLKIQNSFFKSKMITVKAEHVSLRFQLSPKNGKKFPDQAECMEQMLTVLRMYEV